MLENNVNIILKHHIKSIAKNKGIILWKKRNWQRGLRLLNYGIHLSHTLVSHSWIHNTSGRARAKLKKYKTETVYIRIKD